MAVRRRLGDFRLDVVFEAAGEGVTVLFGPSGAGKSQVLAAVAGAARPDAGRIVLGGRVLFDAAAHIDVPLQRRALGWVFQDARLFPHLSVAANLRYGAKRTRGRPVIAPFDEVVGVLGIAALLARRPRDLSGGERQRVAIGRALLSQPRLLLMDEPLSALDAPRRAEILPYLEGLKTRFRLPILYVTHALPELARLADRVVLLEGGTVTAQGPVNAMLGRADLPMLAGRRDAVAAFDAEVVDHDRARGLTRLRAGATVLRTTGTGQAVGTQVRVTVPAREVLVATEPPRGLSARNVVPARVAGLSAGPEGAVTVALQVDGGPDLLAAITADAVADLALAPGRPVWAVIKSMAVDDGGPAADLRAKPV